MTFELYDRLIAGIPETLTVKRCIAGNFWTCVESEAGTGVAVTVKAMQRPPQHTGSLKGMPLKSAAALAKSWNFVEASIGVAALNAYYNTPEIAAANGVNFAAGPGEDDRLNDPYLVYRNFARGKRVGCIGSNSSVVDSVLKDIAEVLLFSEELGTYPLSSVPYLLGSCELAYLPCHYEITKQLEGVLGLCRDNLAIVCGPSVTMSPVLYDYGAGDLSGLVITDPELAFESASGTAVKLMFRAGKKATLRKCDPRRLR